MSGRALACLVVMGALAFVGGCDGDEDGADRATTTTDLADRIANELGELHLSRISEIPDLRAVFYHGSDGTAVEDTSLDAGTTWCRRASYTWAIEDAVADDDFVVRYTVVEESPDCAPTGTPFVLHVTGRGESDGQTVFTGEYTTPAGLHVERTVCEETVDDWPGVCGLDVTLPAPG
jgi:hypothetical protein